MWIGVVIVCAALALWWWLQPERQVRRAQTRLIAAIEGRDFAAFERLLADDYRDRWGHDKANVISLTQEVFQQFLFVTVVREEKGLDSRGAEWVLREKIKLTGTGGPLATYAKDELNRLTQPFEITWRRTGGPTQWSITNVEQPELALP